MRVYTPDEVFASPGCLAMFYGETEVGKTVNLLISSPDPIFMYQFEKRNLDRTLQVVKSIRPDLRLYIAYHETFFDTMEFINRGATVDPENYGRMLDSRTILCDSLSDLMAVQLPIEIQDENFESMKEKVKDKKELTKLLTMQSKTSQEGYGTIAGQTLRFTLAISRLARDEGKYVFLTAREDHHPAWAPQFDFTPLLKGREYGRDFKGMFDLIGRVTKRVKRDESGAASIVYPPMVSFRCPESTFFCKWTGLGDRTSGPLNIEKILAVGMGKEVQKEVVQEKIEEGGK
jgi:hypothetical protein